MKAMIMCHFGVFGGLSLGLCGPVLQVCVFVWDVLYFGDAIFLWCGRSFEGENM